MGVGVCVWGGVIVEQPLLNSPQPSGQESMLEPARWDRGGRRGRRGEVRLVSVREWLWWLRWHGKRVCA